MLLAEEIRHWLIRKKISALIFSAVTINRSSVIFTDPSSEFSTGTTPQSIEPFSTSSKTRAIPVCGEKRLDSPKCSLAARWEKEASGPKKEIFVGFCKLREAEIISRKIAVTAACGNGPELSPCK